MKKPILILIAAIGILISCKKSSSQLPKNPNTINPLLYGTWYVKKIVLGNIVAGATTVNNTIPISFKEDYYTFNTDNSMYISYIASAPTVYTSTYIFTNTPGGSTLSVGSTAITPATLYNITKLSADSLVLFNSNTSTTGGVATTVNTTNYYAHN